VQENVTWIFGLAAHKKTEEEEEAAEEEETSLRGITWIKGLHGLRNG
jgi:hypothetical protein